jgi:hypothetical protein
MPCQQQSKKIKEMFFVVQGNWFRDLGWWRRVQQESSSSGITTF